MPRSPNKKFSSPDVLANTLHLGEAAETIMGWPDNCIDLVITSPPYWDAVDYGNGPNPWLTYQGYLSQLHAVWEQCARVLRPNGKLCINAPIMPIPQAVIKQNTRHLKNIAFDIESKLLTTTGLRRFSLFIWQKQTSKMMFGSYPFPGNILENNTVEFINVYVKSGKPPKFSPAIKEGNKISRTEWLDLAQQVWFMYPADVKRQQGHPAPFPEKLPARLMKLYTYGAAGPFPGELVLDPFVGTGTTCAVAQKMGRRWIGIDINRGFLRYANARIKGLGCADTNLLVGRPKYPGKKDLDFLASTQVSSRGALSVMKHKQKSYGRKASNHGPSTKQLKLV